MWDYLKSRPRLICILSSAVVRRFAELDKGPTNWREQPRNPTRCNAKGWAVRHWDGTDDDDPKKFVKPTKQNWKYYHVTLNAWLGLAAVSNPSSRFQSLLIFFFFALLFGFHPENLLFLLFFFFFFFFFVYSLSLFFFACFFFCFYFIFLSIHFPLCFWHYFVSCEKIVNMCTSCTLFFFFFWTKLNILLIRIVSLYMKCRISTTLIVPYAKS